MRLLSPKRLDVAPLDGSPLPVDLGLIKQHCAVDGMDFDALLTSYLLAAIAWAEGATHRTIFARSHSWVLCEFPTTAKQEIRLPRGKTRSVDSIECVVNGATLTFRGPSSNPVGSDYQEDLRSDEGGVLMPVRSGVWPAVDFDAPAPVVVNFMAGWVAGEVPSDIIHALLFAVSDAFENRGTADMTLGRNFETRETLISSYRLVRWY